MSKEDVVDAPDGIDLVGDVNRDRAGDDKSEQDETVEDEDNQDEEQEEEEEDHNEDYGKEPQTIGQGEMVNSSAHNVDTIEDNQPTVLPEQG
jgi:hypothetical protein